MGRLNPERGAPVMPVDKKSAATIGPMAVDPSSVGSFVDFLRQATVMVDQSNAGPAFLNNGDLDLLSKASSQTLDRRDDLRDDSLSGSRRNESRDDPSRYDSDRSSDEQNARADDSQDVAASQRSSDRDREDRSNDSERSDSSSSNASGDSESRVAASDKQNAASSDGQSSQSDEEDVAAEAGVDGLNELITQQYTALYQNGAEDAAKLATGAINPDQLDPSMAGSAAHDGDQNGDSNGPLDEALQQAFRLDANSDSAKSGLSVNTEIPIEASQQTKGEGDRSNNQQGQQQGNGNQLDIGKMLASEGIDKMLSDEMATVDDSQLTESRASRQPDPSSAQLQAQAVQTVTSNAGPTTQSSGNSGPAGNEVGLSPAATARESASAAKAEQTQGANQMEQVDRAKFVQRVSRAFNSIANQGGTVKLKLHPEELGALTIKVSVKNGLMSAQIETETSAARQLIVNNLSTLRDRLAEQNIKIDQFEVEVGSHSDSDLPDQQQQDESGKNRHRYRSDQSNDQTTAPIDDDETRRSRSPAGISALDLIG